MSQPKAQIELPPKPERETISTPKDVKDLANIINYYEHLVQEWEQWALSVEIITGQNSSNAD